MIINDKPKHFSGLSTDTKPNLGAAGQGFLFTEQDTGLEFSFDSRLGTWINISRTADTVCTGISKVEKTSSKGNDDFYTIYFTNGSQTTFKVTNGTKVTISDHNTWLIDGTDTKVQVTGNTGKQGERGEKGNTGDKGEQGISISKVYYHHSEGLVDVYCIKFSNDTHTEFKITNGTAVSFAKTVEVKSAKDGMTETKIQFYTTYDNEDHKLGTPVSIFAAQGIQGIQGIQGEKGEKGDQGIQGEQGIQGPTGCRGPRGPEGKPGSLEGLYSEELSKKPNGVYSLKAKVIDGRVEFFWE